ncbi:MAG: restriction endonuclease subunit S [Lachnospiraceae bacterium]|nr:restriction endonuclease subunit S [Lachnospiraceae bacterium]
MVIRECLDIIGGNSGLTESVIYWNPPKNRNRAVTVYSGSTLNTTMLGVVDRETIINGKKIKVLKAPAIVIVRKGLAGNTKFIENGEFTINDDAYVITVKQRYVGEINIQWLENVIQRYAESCITSRGTNATFSKEQFLDLEFEYPSMKEQDEIVNVINKINKLKENVSYYIERLKKLNSIVISGDVICKLKAGSIFEIAGGNSGLTEEFIYNNQPTSEQESVAVFSSSMDEATNMGVVSKNAVLNGKKIKCFDAPAVIISRNGQAGKALYIEHGTFTINDHAYVLTVKQSYKKVVDLEWFTYVSEQYTNNCVTSKDSNGTFNKEMFMNEQIDIIDFGAQKKIVKKKREIGVLHCKLKQFRNILDERKH